MSDFRYMSEPPGTPPAAAVTGGIKDGPQAGVPHWPHPCQAARPCGEQPPRGHRGPPQTHAVQSNHRVSAHF